MTSHDADIKAGSSIPKPSIRPRIIIHGGAGNITPTNLSPIQWRITRHALLSILSSASTELMKPNATALDVATHAVSLLEDCPLFNAGKGAVFTRDGTNELEASVMISSIDPKVKGHRKRGVGVMMLRHVKNPVKLAREMLIRGDDGVTGGAQGHVQISGREAERLAGEWGCEMVDESYFWTRKRWEEHRRGLESHPHAVDEETSYGGMSMVEWEESRAPSCPQEVTDRLVQEYSEIAWDGPEYEYVPQGTVGAVVLDSFGTVCVATSTGGITNKLSGRIGDTPTIGAGFFAEEWTTPDPKADASMAYVPQQPQTPLDALSRGDFGTVLANCLPLSHTSSEATHSDHQHATDHKHHHPHPTHHAAAISGTGNGDAFLRLSAARTAIAISRLQTLSLQHAIKAVAGPGGALQQSAGEHWQKTGEGEGGMIGIELKGHEGVICADFNCGGMFRAWVDDEGGAKVMVFREEYGDDVDEAERKRKGVDWGPGGFFPQNALFGNE